MKLSSNMALANNMRPALTKVVHGPPCYRQAVRFFAIDVLGFEVDGLLRWHLEDNLTLLNN